ncbi:MAG: inner membrane-spanning protein YciB, partial [Burkholderiaceae bacterium]
MTKLLADWLPIILFFVAYKLADLYVATAVAIVASALLMGWMRIRGLPIDKMQWLSHGLIVVFGGATLLLQDERFI